jgi:hypothetical protein
MKYNFHRDDMNERGCGRAVRKMSHSVAHVASWWGMKQHKTSVFETAAQKAAIEWKAASTQLPDEARGPGDYRQYRALQRCLPKTHHRFNLLEQARDAALSRFGAAGIPWHDGVEGGPSNHLLSSQVQCANALAPFVGDPSALAAIFGHVLPIRTVLPFGAVTGGGRLSPFDATDHVVFEWQGLENHLSEWKGVPTRGSQATSADAAIRYQASDGAIEMALIEWKFTESYFDRELSTEGTSYNTRRRRYLPILERADGPIRMDLVDFDDLLADPIYQLMRLALLAHCIERANEQGVDRVRVVYVSPSGNDDLRRSTCTPGYMAKTGGGSYFDTWRTVLRRPDRMVFMDSDSLVADGSPLDDEFRRRYSVLGA